MARRKTTTCSNLTQVTALATGKEEYEELVEALLVRMNEREDQYEKYKDEQGYIAPTEFYQNLEAIYVVLHQVSKLIPQLNTTSQATLAKLLVEAREKGIYFVSIGEIAEIGKGYDEVTKVLKRSEEVILTVRLNDQTVFTPNNKSYKEESLAEDEAYYIRENIAYLIKKCK